MQLPIGYDDFRKVVEKGLNYVDKSLFIKEVLDDINTEAIVITRPRRFGKTFNLSMLHCFLSAEVYGQPTKHLFEGLEITRCMGDYRQHQGKYPVVSITFKDVKTSSYTLAYSGLSKLISDLYLAYEYLLSSPKLSNQHKRNFKNILEESINEAKLKSSLKDLMYYLFLHYGIKPWLLIDEYDTPIQSAYSKGYYNEMIEFMHGLLGAALKNNPYLNKAVITGILRVAKESLFSGVNNLEVYSLLRDEYSQHFGFTEPEVDRILEASNLSEKAAEIKAWYNGYQFGNTLIYNIANCVKRKGVLEPYWVDTSDNQLIKDLMKKTPLQFKEELEGLVLGNSVEKVIDEQLSFQYLGNNPDALWNLLLMAGYLKPSDSRNTDQGVLAQLTIPNREVRNLYRQIIEQWLSNGYGVNWYNAFMASLVQGKLAEFKQHLEKVLLQIVSCHDFAKEPEAFYHGLLLGFMVSLNQTHEIKSNRESGLGRFDLVLIPKESQQMGIVMELKIKGEKETLAECVQRALEQIQQKKYTEELQQRGITQTIQIGIGFAGKELDLAYVVN